MKLSSSGRPALLAFVTLAAAFAVATAARHCGRGPIGTPLSELSTGSGLGTGVPAAGDWEALAGSGTGPEAAAGDLDAGATASVDLSAETAAEAVTPPAGVDTGPAPSGGGQGTAGLVLDFDALVLDESAQRLVQVLPDGRRVTLTLDPGLQERLTAVVAQHPEPAEALVAVEPATGRILAWVEEAAADSPTPHPASSAAAYAASIFKIVTAAELIEEEGVDATASVCVSRGRRTVSLDDLEPNAARDTTCGNMAEALAHSTNVYFARLVDQNTSSEELSSFAERMGFNAQIPFEVPVEVSTAVVPEDRLERARMAAGFRHATLSPLHGALLAAAVANGGVMMQPTLVLGIAEADGSVTYKHEPRSWREAMSPETARVLARALVTTTETGTARQYFSQRAGWPEGLEVAGKTGTLTNRSDEEPQPDPLITYSWFVGFAPTDTPQIAVSALVYNGPRWHIRGGFLASEAIIFHHLHGRR